MKTTEEVMKVLESLRKRRRRIAKMVVAIVLWMIWWVVADLVILRALARGYNLNPWNLTDFLTLYWKIGPILLIYDSFMFFGLVFGVIVISRRWGERYKEPEKI